MELQQLFSDSSNNNIFSAIDGAINRYRDDSNCLLSKENIEESIDESTDIFNAIFYQLQEEEP